MRSSCDHVYDSDCPACNAKAAVNHQPQVGGDHYRKYGADLQVWDLWLRWKLNPFQAIIIKHVARYRDKLGMTDLLKARQYLDKLIEEESKNPDLPKGAPDAA